MYPHKKIQLDASQLRVIILTFVGATIQLFFFAFLVWQFSRSAILNLSTFEPQLFAIIGYFALTIIYSIPTSLSFTPKRIISPLNIQIITVGMLLIILSISLMLGESRSIDTESYLVSITLISLMMILAGVAQTEFVKRAIGMNGTIEDLDRKSYLINMTFTKVASVIKQETLLNLGEFKIMKDSTDMIVLKSKLRTFEKMIMVISKFGDKSEKTLLATISYESRYYSIFKTPNASKLMGSIYGELKSDLKKLQTDLKITEKEPNDLVSLEASRYALRETQSKFGSVNELPRYYIFVSIFIIVTAIIISVAYYYKMISDELFIGSIILIVVEGLFVFIPVAIEAKKTKLLIE